MAKTLYLYVSEGGLTELQNAAASEGNEHYAVHGFFSAKPHVDRPIRIAISRVGPKSSVVVVGPAGHLHPTPKKHPAHNAVKSRLQRKPRRR